MTRKEYLDLFTPIYDRFAIIGAGKVVKGYEDGFDIVEDPTKDFKTNEMSGLGAWDEVEEDSDSGQDSFVIGYEKSLSIVQFRKYFYVSFAMSEQMEYADLEKKIVDSEALGKGSTERLNIETSAVMYGGFTTAGPDGEYLYDTDHPKNPEETTTYYDNLLTGGFSHDSLEAAEAQIADNHFNLEGTPIMLDETPILYYAPALHGQVMRVLSERAQERPGTDNRDINIYAGKYIPKKWTYLSAKMGGSDTAWYIVYPSLGSLKLVIGQKPQFASWIENLLHRYYFDGWMWAKCGATSWRGLFASTGLG